MRIDLNAASNMLGPLPGEVRARLMAAIANPCEETWDDAHTIILSWPERGMGVTLWQAVIAVDPSFPRTGPVTRWADDNSELGGHSEPVSGWERIPDAELILAAINYATR
jgi:hypothetical protein